MQIANHEQWNRLEDLRLSQDFTRGEGASQVETVEDPNETITNTFNLCILCEFDVIIINLFFLHKKGCNHLTT